MHKKPFLFPEEEKHIVACIQEAERNTSGEIRVFIESKCDYIDALDRAKEVFVHLEMHKTKFRNAALIYIATKDRQIAIFSDEGIFNKSKDDKFWEKILEQLKKEFKAKNYAKGIAAAILKMGDLLKIHFPYSDKGDVNELPDDIVYGE